MTDPTLDEVAAAAVRWQRATFPHATPETTLEHLRREIAELAANPRDSHEIADAFLLLVCLADRAGVDLAAAAGAKLAVNLTRRWGPPDAHGVSEHIRDEAPDEGPGAPSHR